MTDDEERIRAKAYELWEAEGRPEGRQNRHWEEAREIIALQDSNDTTLRPVAETIADRGEPLLAIENQGEFPTLTDQPENAAAPTWGEAAAAADQRPLAVEDAPARPRRGRTGKSATAGQPDPVPTGEAAPVRRRGRSATDAPEIPTPPKSPGRRSRGTVNGTGERA